MNISILGCGWLGLPLAKYLKNKNNVIKGSTTSVEKIDLLENYGIEPYHLKLTPHLDNPDLNQHFWNSEVLVLNIPPGRKRNNVIDHHTKQIHSVSEAITDSSINFVVFISSTSVYPKYPGWVNEEDTISGQAKRDSGNALLKAEKILMNNSAFETTVVRFGGLIGGNRHPVNYLADKKDLDRANAPVNLIHRDDCISIITQIIEQQITGEIFNAVSDEHPTRKEFYTRAAKQAGLTPPTFNTDKNNGYKIVSNEKLQSSLGYNFKYPNPLEMNP